MLFQISHFYNWSFCFKIFFNYCILQYVFYDQLGKWLPIIHFISTSFFSCLIFNIYFRIFLLNFYLEKFILVLWMHLSKNLKELIWRYMSILLSSVFSYRNLVYCMSSLITPSKLQHFLLIHPIYFLLFLSKSCISVPFWIKSTLKCMLLSYTQ